MVVVAIGIVTVFLVLVLLVVTIKAFGVLEGKLSNLLTSANKKDGTLKGADGALSIENSESQLLIEAKEPDADGVLLAVITAAVTAFLSEEAAKTDSRAPAFIVRDFRKIR